MSPSANAAWPVKAAGAAPCSPGPAAKGPQVLRDRWEGSQREAEPQLVWWWGMVPQARPLPSGSLVPTPG